MLSYVVERSQHLEATPKVFLIRTVSISLVYFERNHPTKYKPHFIRGNGRLEAAWPGSYYRYADTSERKLPYETKKNITLTHVHLGFHSDYWIE
jgi:hypothetical protein